MNGGGEEFVSVVFDVGMEGLDGVLTGAVVREGVGGSFGEGLFDSGKAMAKKFFFCKN